MEEQISIIDPITGNILIESYPRSLAHREKRWHRTVHVWIYSGDRVLLQRRASSKESFPNYLDISAAGHITAGDSIVESAIREVEEELGITITESELIALGEGRQEFDIPESNFYDREIPSIFIVKKQISTDEITVQKSEVSDVLFLRIDEFSNMVEARSDELVPHWDEYERVISYLSNE